MFNITGELTKSSHRLTYEEMVDRNTLGEVFYIPDYGQFLMRTNRSKCTVFYGGVAADSRFIVIGKDGQLQGSPNLNLISALSFEYVGTFKFKVT